MSKSNGYPDKKKRELRVLQDVLEFARQRGGEGRRNANRTKGKVDQSERPDFVIATPDNRLIGIEHFRVDHYVDNRTIPQSLSGKLQARMQKERSRILQIENSKEKNQEMQQALADILRESNEQLMKGSLSDLVRSLGACLNGKNGHIAKTSAYRSSLSNQSPQSKVELGFLIEFHSDFQRLFMNEEGITRKLTAGELPLFSEVFSLLEKAAEKVDWMLLAFYGTLSSDIVDAAIIRCQNGMFTKSAARQNLQKTEYLGSDEDRMPVFHYRGCTVSHTSKENEIIYQLERAMETEDPEVIFQNSLDDVSRAFEANRKGRPFAASIQVQMLYELFKDDVKKMKRQPTPDNLKTLLHEMDPMKSQLILQSFTQRWKIGEGVETG